MVDGFNEIYDKVKQYREEDVSWRNIADLINREFGICHGRDFYRSHFNKKDLVEALIKVSKPLIRNVENNSIEDNKEIIESIYRERIKLNDEIAQKRAYLRRIAREDNIKEIAKYFADRMSTEKILPEIYEPVENAHRAAILEISDWHYGINIDNPFNKYSPEICVERVSKLKDKVLKIIHKEKIKTLYIANLSDMIAGNIHMRLRLESRYDVITQTMYVSEILAEFIYELGKVCEIEYYDCYDNHSRIEEKKTDSLELETLVRVIRWHLSTRFENNKNIHIHTDNEFGDGIISFNVLGHKVIGVHGDLDSEQNVVYNMESFTKNPYDLVLTAHRHHFSSNEVNKTIVVSNGSLMGTDSYAVQLRKSAMPSQNLIIVNNDNPVACIYRIVV